MESSITTGSTLIAETWSSGMIAWVFLPLISQYPAGTLSLSFFFGGTQDASCAPLASIASLSEIMIGSLFFNRTTATYLCTDSCSFSARDGRFYPARIVQRIYLILREYCDFVSELRWGR